ncbi:MAG TPA: glycosyltransferase [Gemmatimonadales bacterium]|nr:glycosyltransferase [Gemmatimonadales bacterium]
MNRAFLLVYLLPWLSLLRISLRKPRLSDDPPRRGRRVSVIVPARNEAINIAEVVNSILGSDYDSFEVIVVNDRSTDDTAAIVRGVASADNRVKLLEGAELPEGWFGKPWACVQGAREATGELLLFTDADTRHHPGLLAHAVGGLERHGAQLLTVVPSLQCVSFWERLVMPQIIFLLSQRYPPREINRPHRLRDVIANGQFILVTRESYDRVGGHGKVREAVAEDLALAQAYYRNGERIYCAFAADLMETRMYRDLRSLIEGWSKNIFLGSQASFPDEPWRRALTPLMLVAAMLFWLVPLVVLGLSAVGAPGLPDATGAAVSATLFWIAVTAGMRIPPWYGLGYPLGVAMSVYIVTRSIARGSRRVEWRGRVYSSAGTGPQVT